jgi:hypothetical protein
MKTIWMMALMKPTTGMMPSATKRRSRNGYRGNDDCQPVQGKREKEDYAEVAVDRDCDSSQDGEGQHCQDVEKLKHPIFLAASAAIELGVLPPDHQVPFHAIPPFDGTRLSRTGIPTEVPDMQHSRR